MGEESDQTALLEWEEVAAVDEPSLATEVNESVRATTVGSRALGSTVPGIGWSSSPGERLCPGELASSDTSVLTDKGASSWIRQNFEQQKVSQHVTNRGVVQWSRIQKDQVLAVFVVSFDTRSGNMLEWCLPQDFNLDGVEFKSMASGSHRIASDFVYFRKDSYFGLACFANLPVESELERGARMKSVGILSPSYTTLYHHMTFLEKQVRDQLRCPGQYSALEDFFEQSKGLLPAKTARNNMAAALSTPKHFMIPEMKVTHPDGCMSQFVQFFEEQVMVLWKFALLRRRILIFSPPPVGEVCYRVYSCCALANVPLPNVSRGLPPFRPFFYVNVADISTLEIELSYVACTTERIFEEKKHLFDVYVANQNVTTHRESLRPLLRLTSSDREKYKKLQEKRKRLVGRSGYTEEELFILFFSELNTKIFQTLLEVASSVDRALTEQHVRRMGLDPQADHKFLVDLLETYGIDVMLMIDTSCCF